jgi:hypothetical protein
MMKAAMPKAILMMLLVVVSSCAAAEWITAGINETGTVYADPATIRRSGNTAQLWSLYDLNTPRASNAGKLYLSSRSELELDCVEEKIRTLAYFWHSRNMGAGGVVASDSFPEKWERIPPRSVGKRIWQIACGK